MTKDEALYKVKGYLTDIIPIENYSEVEEIIKALEQEPCEDCISRQDAIDAWDKLSKRGRTEFDQVLMTLPSAEPKTGRWTRSHTGTIGEGSYCSRCGKMGYKTDFCPNCGAMMKGEEQ